VIPYWVLKRDAEHYPVRFLAGLWQQRQTANFGMIGTELTPKEKRQLKSLREALGDLTQCVVEWMLNPVNWWHFCQQVRAESGLRHAPPYPHVGFLLRHHGRALRIMRRELGDSTAPADVAFCAKLDGFRYEQMKTLASVYADGIAERLAKIEGAKTLTDIQRVFIEIVDERIPASQ
jgi:hypothetical protein